jgi:hypothetical protein
LRAGVKGGVKTIWSGSVGTHRFTYTELATMLTEATTMQPRLHRLRITIHVDGYPEQSYARIERWDGNTWRWVWELPGGLLKTKQPIMRDRPPDSELVREDRFQLLFLATDII